MRTPTRLQALLLLAFWLVLGNRCANANCSAFDALPEIYVGNKANDVACTYDTIQAAITAATCAYGTNIFITDELSYSAQHLSIAGKKLNLIGRAPGLHCGYIGPGARPEQAPSAAAIPRETISGTGGAYLPTMTITGASKIALINLEIRDGHTPNDGGGISYTGTGTLQLNNVLVDNNLGGNGGGLAVTAQGGTVTANLNSGTQIVNNIGQFSGGGIFMKGLSTSEKLYLMVNSGVQIDGNTAQQSGGGLQVEGMAGLYTQFNVQIAGNMAPNGYGGGIDFVAPAFAQLYGNPLIQGNTAEYGGGMAIKNNQDIQGNENIEYNKATQYGGGIYVSGGNASVTSDIENNTAVDGSAIYAEGGDGGAFNLGSGSVSYNVNRDANNLPTSGSTLTIKGGDFFPVYADDVRMHDNYGGHVVHVLGDFTIKNSLLVDNVTTAELVLNEPGGNIGADWSFITIAHNQINGATVFRNTGLLYITASIIGQPGLAAMASSGTQAFLGAGHILANDLDGLNPATSLQADPMFVDPANGDFHLLAQRVNGSVIASPGIDFFGSAGGIRAVPSVNNSDSDVDHRPGLQDIDGVGGAAGANYNVYDLGAYEMQPYADRIFADGFGDPVLLAY